MRITEVRLRRVEGTLPTDGPLWEDRLVRPIDIYPEYRDDNSFEGGAQTSDGFRITTHFVEVITDEGLIGRAGPIPEAVALIVAGTLRGILVGRDPLATEARWDQMHRMLVHGRQGNAMLAISAVDCALWDIRGLALGIPVYRLLGGPTRETVPAYASMLGFSVSDHELVQRRAADYRDAGFVAQKWFFRHGPSSGHAGMAANVELVRSLREAVGDDYDLMFDCWQAMDVPYLTELARRIEPFRPRWLEEVAMPDRLDSYQRIQARTSIPLAGAEHEYTRWGFKRWFDAGALDVVQPDIYWAGGLSEVTKIAAAASMHDLQTIPHGHSASATLHFSLAQSPAHTPLQEHLEIWNRVHQFFLAAPVVPVDGLLRPNDLPGLGMGLDEAKMERDDIVMSETGGGW